MKAVFLAHFFVPQGFGSAFELAGVENLHVYVQLVQHAFVIGNGAGQAPEVNRTNGVEQHRVGHGSHVISTLRVHRRIGYDEFAARFEIKQSGSQHRRGGFARGHHHGIDVNAFDVVVGFCRFDGLDHICQSQDVLLFDVKRIHFQVICFFGNGGLFKGKVEHRIGFDAHFFTLGGAASNACQCAEPDKRQEDQGEGSAQARSK